MGNNNQTQSNFEQEVWNYENRGTYSWNKNVLDFVGAASLPKGNLSETRAEGVGFEEYQILQRENRTISVSTLMFELCIFLVRIQNANKNKIF